MLEISNLYYKIAQNEIIKDFNLHLKKGELITLFGASGCGKSTLLACVAGILKYESGFTYTVRITSPVIGMKHRHQRCMTT